MRFIVEKFATNWQDLYIGIVIGFTLSVIVFVAASNLLVNTAEKKS